MDQPEKKKDGAKWHIFNAEGKVLGRMSVEVAGLLIGKHRVDYMPNKIAPIYVVVTNTDKVHVTGRKERAKMYRRYSGYPGGLRERTLGEQRQRDSRKLIRAAVTGMLPKNKLRVERLRHLKLYKGEDHPHQAQL